MENRTNTVEIISKLIDSEDDLKTFENQINEKLQSGYKLNGDVIVSSEKTGNFLYFSTKTRFTQALILKRD